MSPTVAQLYRRVEAIWEDEPAAPLNEVITILAKPFLDLVVLTRQVNEAGTFDPDVREEWATELGDLALTALRFAGRAMDPDRAVELALEAQQAYTDRRRDERRYP